MGFTPAYRQSVEDALSAILPIRTRAMFGGLSVYSDDLKTWIDKSLAVAESKKKKKK